MRSRGADLSCVEMFERSKQPLGALSLHLARDRCRVPAARFLGRLAIPVHLHSCLSTCCDPLPKPVAACSSLPSTKLELLGGIGIWLQSETSERFRISSGVPWSAKTERRIEQSDKRPFAQITVCSWHINGEDAIKRLPRRSVHHKSRSKLRRLSDVHDDSVANEKVDRDAISLLKKREIELAAMRCKSSQR